MSSSRDNLPPLMNILTIGNGTTPEHARASTEKSPRHLYPSTPTSSLPQNSEDSIPPKEIDSQPQQEAYSVFAKREKHIAVFLITFAATFSPLSSFIFFPAINALSVSLNVSVEKINLTVTSYMIVAGLAPAIVGDMADMTGRRNVYLLTIFIYAAANIGLAVQNSWIALFLLRMMQSAGGAATIAMGYGVISDIAPPSERGGYVGVVLLGPNIATAIGPILGGALSQAPGWRWIFWIPAIASGICLLLIALFLPETSRCIVGNGSRKVSALYRPIFSYHQSRNSSTMSALNEEEITPRNFRIPNPLATLKILVSRDSLLITAIYGVYYMNFSCLQGSLSTLFIDIYGLSELNAGLVYLPFGVGSCIGAYCSGKIMNRDYRLTARAHNLVIDTNHGDDLTGFPIEKARFRSIWYSICATGISTAGYGWSIQSRTVSNLPSFVKKTSTIDAHGPINHIAYSCSPRSTIYHRFRYSDHFQLLRYSPNRPEPQVPGCSAGSKQYCPLLACGCRACFPSELFGFNGTGMDVYLIWWTMSGVSWVGVAGVEVWEALETAVVPEVE